MEESDHHAPLPKSLPSHLRPPGLLVCVALINQGGSLLNLYLAGAFIFSFPQYVPEPVAVIFVCDPMHSCLSPAFLTCRADWFILSSQRCDLTTSFKQREAS